MLFLSPGIVYWVESLLHRCDSNAVFIVDVSRVYARGLKHAARDAFWEFSKNKHLLCQVQ